MNGAGNGGVHAVVMHRQSLWRAHLTVGILALINLLNYMDRFTIPAVLSQVSDTFGLTLAQSGLLQTVFIISYMVFAPLFGYLGDNYNRKWLIVVGITIWSLVTFASSFVPADSFWLFLVTRGLVGIGESSYITVSPSMVGDMFTGEKRFSMLTAIYLTVPVGSGLGYLVGGMIAELFGDWRYALRFTPFIALGCVLVTIFFVHEPIRGYADRVEQLGEKAFTNSNTSVAPLAQNDGNSAKQYSSTMQGLSNESHSEEPVQPLFRRAVAGAKHWLRDVVEILKIPTFVLNAAGFTAVCFATGALSWWSPTYLADAFAMPTANNALSSEPTTVAFAMGLLTCVAGFVGVLLGLLLARKLRPILNRKADPYSCACGLLFAGPIVYFCLVVAPFSDLAAYGLIFLGEVGLCLNWALTTDIMLRVVIPPRRSSANAFSMLISHLFGDALCPLLLGAIADSITLKMCADNDIACTLQDSDSLPLSFKCQALMYSLFINAFVCVLGGGAYLFCALTIDRDADAKEKLQAEMEKLNVIDKQPTTQTAF